MKFLFNFFALVFSLSLFAQATSKNTSYIYKTEEFILYNKLDSANYYLKNIKESSYKGVLAKLIKKEELTYLEYYEYTSKIGNRKSVNFNDVSDYINQFVKKPKSSKKISLNYFKIKWTQVFKHTDNGNLETASKIQKELESYLNSFDATNVDVIKAKIKSKTHQAVMYLIQEDVENGKKLCLNNIAKAKELKDKKLQITFLYHLTDFLLVEGKLQEYIDVSEESLKLEEELDFKSSYYHGTIEHLINAYVYKRGHNERVINLIDILYKNDVKRIQTYSLYAQLVSVLDANSPLLKQILKKFEVKNVPDLIKKFEALGKDLNSNEFYHILNSGSNALAAHGYSKLAINYKDKAIVITRKVYSQDLTESLANYKTEQAVKEKEKEIKHAEEKTRIYSILAVFCVVLLLIALLVLIKIRKQSKELSVKNKIIENALIEKELLVKEVHHRVKNNFQIVSSLLELQTKGIEDEKALELANEGRNRVKSMALIHQKLYQNESGLIDFDEYIRLLIKELSLMYSSQNEVKTSVSSENVMFDVDTAIPLGLIINEIITNSYKYAFRNDKENNLSISIKKGDDNNYKLIIKDNGPGLSKNVDARKAKSLGLRLVNRLVKQLHGTLEQSNNEGAKFEISFKDSNARQLVN